MPLIIHLMNKHDFSLKKKKSSFNSLTIYLRKQKDNKITLLKFGHNKNLSLQN